MPMPPSTGRPAPVMIVLSHVIWHLSRCSWPSSGLRLTESGTSAPAGSGCLIEVGLLGVSSH